MTEKFASAIAEGRVRHRSEPLLDAALAGAVTLADRRPWVVTCLDVPEQPSRAFASRADAETWAEWGHLCTTRHAIDFVGDGR